MSCPKCSKECPNILFCIKTLTDQNRLYFEYIEKLKFENQELKIKLKKLENNKIN